LRPRNGGITVSWPRDDPNGITSQAYDVEQPRCCGVDMRLNTVTGEMVQRNLSGRCCSPKISSSEGKSDFCADYAQRF
jgi:hypothetical protein